MKAAVIGANGYIGRHLDHYLRSMGVNTTCYDFQDEIRDHYKSVDLTKQESVEGIDLDVDYIFMFAGLTGTYVGFEKYETFIDVNELGLLNLLDAIRHSGYRPKVVFPSTRLVYKGSDMALKEDDEKETKTLYAVNKQACEGILYAYRQSFGIPYTIFRICIPYGNLLSMDYSFGTIGFFIKQARSGKDITLYGGGCVKRTFTHIEDVCRQVIMASMKENTDGEIYNVGGQVLSLRDAAKIIASRFGISVVDIDWPDKDYRIESGHTFFDDSKIRSLLNLGTYKTLQEFAHDL